jgi:peptide methionine sulfoxide reductase MsrA
MQAHAQMPMCAVVGSHVVIGARPRPRPTAIVVHAEAQRRQHTIPMIVERTAVAAATCALVASLCGQPALAVEMEPSSSAVASTAATAVEPVFFGNGCFWGRQKDFVDAEMALGRQPGDISAVVGYAGGKLKPSQNKVCYYYAPEDTVYERLGHAEVVQVELRGDERAEQFRRLARVYFSQFRQLPGGKMMRQDPQDAGPGYRNVVGLPGGVQSPLFPLLQEANVHGMRLLQGSGNEWTADGKPTEGDELNTVWVVDSDALPFYRAEKYHQYHNGLGKAFPARYTKEMKQAAEKAGRVAETGCPEFFFLGS